MFRFEATRRVVQHDRIRKQVPRPPEWLYLLV